jgi:hypothetical protein
MAVRSRSFMSDTSLRTITLDSESLDAAIDVLSSAAASFRLTRRERIGYWTLMVSVDLAIVTFVALLALLLIFGFVTGFGGDPKGEFGTLIELGVIPFVVSFVGG